MRIWHLVLALLLAGPVQAKWLVAETENFRLHGRISEKQLREQAAVLEDFRGLLVAATNAGQGGGTMQPRLDVYLVRSMAEAEPIRATSKGAAGFYFASAGGVAAYVDLKQMGMSTLLHEYAHHFMLASGTAVYPAWYVEGFAEYFMTARFQPERIEMGHFDRNRASWIVNGNWLPMDRLLAKRLRSKDREELAMFYAQSWALTHYLFRTEGMGGKLAAYLAAVGQGADAVEAFKAHVDADLDGFLLTLKAYFKSGKLAYSVISRAAAAPATVTIRLLPAAADDLLLPLAELERLPGHPALRERAKSVVRKAAAKHLGDPMAERALALLALRFGARDEAVQRLDALLQESPEDASLLLWRAQAAAEESPDSREALRFLVRSYKANPNDWRTLWAYARARGARTQALNDNDLNVLMLARELAPQVDEISVDLAIALARLDRLEEAGVVLGPVAHAPHGGALNGFAQRLLDAAETGDGPGFLAVVERGGEEEEEEPAG